MTADDDDDVGRTWYQFTNGRRITLYGWGTPEEAARFAAILSTGPQTYVYQLVEESVVKLGCGRELYLDEGRLQPAIRQWFVERRRGRVVRYM